LFHSCPPMRNTHGSLITARFNSRISDSLSHTGGQIGDSAISALQGADNATAAAGVWTVRSSGHCGRWRSCRRCRR
jgi:hypothetical protein